MSLIRRWWPVLVLALAPLLPLWPAVFGGLAIGPWDQIRAMAPWNGPAPTTPWDVLQADAVLQFAPWRSMVFQAWSNGQLPFWNPYQLMGTPLLANSQSAGFYPPHILLGLLHVPVYSAMTFLAWLHLFWAGLGVYLLVRRLGGLRVGGVVAGTSFSLSAFMISWTSLPSVIMTVSWIPWMIACALAVFQTGLFWAIDEPPLSFQAETLSPQEALARVLSQQRARLRWTAGLALSTGMMVLAGHLQFAAFGLLGLVVMVAALTVRASGLVRHTRVIRVTMGPDGRRERSVQVSGLTVLLPALMPVGRSLIAVILGFCLAAPQLLPVLAFSKHSHRQAVASSNGYDQYVSGAISPLQLSGAVFPAALGHPLQASNVYEGVNSYWPALVKRGADFSESAIGIGPLVFALLFLLRRPDWLRAETAGVAGIGLLGLLVALGTPFDRLLYFGVPGWAATGSPGRGGVLFVLCACVLAGLGTTRLIREGLGTRRWIYPLSALAISLLTFVLPGYAASGVAADVARQISGAVSVATFPAMVAIALVAVLMFFPATTRFRKIAMILCCVALAPLLVNGLFPLSFGKPLGKPVLEPGERFAAINGDWELALRVPAVMPANTASLFGLHDVAGYDSLLDRDAKAALDAANHTDSSPPTNGNMLFVKPSVDVNALASLGVTRILTLTSRNGGAGRQFSQTAILGPGRLSSPHNDGKIEAEGFDRISVIASGPGTVTLRDRNTEGWSAEVDGKPTAIAAGFFRQVDLPAGKHKVDFSYVPPGFRQGIELFVVGLVALAVLLAPTFRSQPRRGPA